jgi:hypothetical protein
MKAMIIPISRMMGVGGQIVVVESPGNVRLQPAAGVMARIILKQRLMKS